ncbi:MAG: hypothetical protein HY319_10595 [Armatimonadetes bacterium]|nr:hypothetical protein [Armatimonadota bacterium]
MAMDAGNPIGNIGSPKPQQYTPPRRTELPAENLGVEPADVVSMGQSQVAPGGDVVSTGVKEVVAARERPATVISSGFLPVEVGGAFVAGVNPAIATTSDTDYSQLTALNGLNSTTLVGLDGRVLASVNPLQPVREVPQIERSGGLTGLNGLGSTEFYTLGGKVITLG